MRQREKKQSAWGLMGGSKGSTSGPLDLQLGEELKGLLRIAANSTEERVTSREVVLAMLETPTCNAYAVIQQTVEVRPCAEREGRISAGRREHGPESVPLMGAMTPPRAGGH